MEDFIVPPVEEKKPTLSSKEAASTAFYAAATSSENPVEDYQKAVADLELEGRSAFVEMAQQAWEREQDESNRNILSELITDKTISADQKRIMLQTYSMTGFIQPDLKEKYIQQTAAKQVGLTQEDIEAQDVVIETLRQRRAAQEKDIQQEKIKSGTFELLPILQGIGGVASSIVMSIPAGYAGIYASIKEKDPEAAVQLIKRIQSSGYLPKGQEAQKVMQDIAEVAEALGIPARWIGEKTLDISESPAAATIAEITLDPLNFIPIGLAVKQFKGDKPPLEVPPESPANVTNVANPQVAAKLGAGAVVDKTGQLATAIGTDRGTIINDWVLSKPLPASEQKLRPDLVEELNRIDAEMRGVFQQYRYDPNIMNATAREQETAQLWEVIRQSRGPVYQQANSTILETDNLFAGTAIYGRTPTSGYLRESDAIKAKDKLQESLLRIPEDLRGTLEVVKVGSEYVIQHNWRKEYDEIGSLVFGPDAVKTSIFGMDVSGLARSSLGRWIFPTGWAPTWVERGAARGTARAAIIERKLMRELQDKISPLASKYGKEWQHLLREGEELGKDYFSPSEISSMFPHLSTKQVDELFEAKVYWSRMQEYNYNFFNRLERKRLSDQGMQGLFDDVGNFVGPATKNVTAAEIDKIGSVWNFDTSNALKYTDQLKKRKDKTLVRLDSPIILDTGEKFNYGLVGTKHKLGILPRETLPRIPGYSPRRVKENFYVDIKPRKLFVDGNLITDSKSLDAHKLTKAADVTEAGARKAAANIQALYPDHDVIVRPERQDSLGQIITDYKVYNELYRHSMRRGERLPSSTGEARYEDYLSAEINTVKTLSRLEAFESWDTAFQKAFVKEYKDFLPKYEFPRLKTDIVSPNNMSRDTAKQFKNAQRLFDFYARQKNFETLGDFIWKRMMYTVADALEHIKIPAELFREVGKMGNPLMNARKLITTAYIHLFPTRQWIIQPAQMAELVAINPAHGIRNLQLIPMILLDLGADAKMMKGLKPAITWMTDKMAKASHKTGNVSPDEYREILKGIKQAGIIESVDMNSIIHGTFRNVEEAFVPTTWEKVQAGLSKSTGYGLLKKGTHVSRNVGFDAAEITNQIGIWLQTRSTWIDQNPKAKWNTKENIEAISHEAWRRSGNMTRAGNLPYQEGALSIVLQFAAIQQKLLMNLLQDTATTMTAAQRAKLTALRLGAYGVKYGLPGGALVYYFIDNEADKETKDFMNQDVIRRGLVDHATNSLIASVIYPDDAPDLAVTKSLSPYSESFLPMLDLIHSTWLMLDEDPVTKSRIPMVTFASSFGKAIDDMQGWWTTREVNEEAFGMMAMEAAELASGFNAYWQGMLMLGMQDKVSRMGHKYGLEATKQEAYAKMFFGIPTQKEEDLVMLTKLERNKNKQIETLAKDIHTQLMNQRHKIGEDSFEIYGRRLNSFISMIDSNEFNKQDKYKIMERIIELDRRSFTTTREAVFASYWARYSQEMTNDRQKMMDILERTDLPKANELASQLKEGKL